ncbi:uncharacterized protein Z518_11366 [Rhinocladiella mackenziei CBS 650.93]|uniref:Spindle pole body component n=1 Tax=Rhinocladiella mackenziei CBS 650.93 TaxID=1442369 RepID=A0A0D2I0X7_9EURO|nr:uncharacterized protein Z518_11366 [Rhinocladiella mackenziei CBS 650.93]KIW99378.1 hypothetical protein Z518_11366 [Rhinocladiella mackenziei CBS 650.93]
MASTTTMNAWLEELVLSILPPTVKSADVRKIKDNFIRRVKHHNYGRTNQFAVIDKLSGLEEKFQVLNLDELAGEMYSCRMELNKHDEHWLPDILDFLLHLSHDPASNIGRKKFPKFQPRSEAPPTLKWTDITADDPIDPQDLIWRMPEYSDFSSDNDEILILSTTTSPVTLKQHQEEEIQIDRVFDTSSGTENLNSSSTLEMSQFWRASEDFDTLTEKQAVREVLFMLGGHPTSVFTTNNYIIRANPRYRIRHLESNTSNAVLGEAASVGSRIASIRQWLRIPQSVGVLQLVQSGIGDKISEFQKAISRMHHDILHSASSTGVVSLLQILQMVRKEILPLATIWTITSHLSPNDSITALNALYSQSDLAYSSYDSVARETLLPIFLSALRLYVKPVDVWLRTGQIEAREPFFISRNKQPRDATTLWHDWFILSSKDNQLIPAFLKKYATTIFTAGKTAAFLHNLGRVAVNEGDDCPGLSDTAAETAHLVDGSPMPFSATFELLLDRHLSSLLDSSTTRLKNLLEGSCGLTKLLDAFDYLYLSKDGVILDRIESRMFDQIDRCVEMWNDRFLLADILADAYQDIDCVDSESITVHAGYTSSRSMESRRRSVKILGAVTVSYQLSWPIANIILPASTVSYQRIALTLRQIRRAKSILERRAYFHAQNIPLGTDTNDQKTAQVLYSKLSVFVNVLYAHLTTCTVQPLTSTMRSHLSVTGSVDEMIRVHRQYIEALEHACLSSKRIKPLRDSLLAILDLCIRFADIVSSPTSAVRCGSADPDFEASSFVSARSQRRRRRTIGGDSSSSDVEDAGDGEGYSTFILDEDTTVMQELTNVSVALNKHLSFLMAGLRGVARSSGEVGDGFELLADGLEGIFPVRKSMVY